MTRYYTTSDVAKICNVHRNTIIGSIRKGFLRIYRTPGGHARISEDDLLEFCRQRNLPINLEGHRNDKILVVDDDPLLSKMLKTGLEKFGYRVMLAKNGYDAGFLTLEWSPDLMLLDIMLPDIQGNEVVKRIRKSTQTKSLPILAMSGVNDQDKIDAMMVAGVNEFLPKPFEIARLVEVIKSLIGGINKNVPIEEEGAFKKEDNKKVQSYS